jgi:hypothetical protein
MFVFVHPNQLAWQNVNSASVGGFTKPYFQQMVVNMQLWKWETDHIICSRKGTEASKEEVKFKDHVESVM